MCTQKTCISSVKHCLANLTRLVSILRTTEDSSAKKLFLIMNQNVWKWKPSRVPKTQFELGSASHFRYRYRSTWYKNQISSVTSILRTGSCLSLMLWIIWLRKLKLKRKQTSFKLNKQGTLTCTYLKKTLKQRDSHCVGIEAEGGTSKSSSTQFLQTEKNQLLTSGNLFGDFAIPYQSLGSSFNSARYVIKLIKSYSLPILLKEWTTTIFERNKLFGSFHKNRFKVSFLEILKYLGAATSLDSIRRAHKTSETKGFFPFDWFIHPDKLNNKVLPLYEAFNNKLQYCNLHEEPYWLREAAL